MEKTKVDILYPNEVTHLDIIKTIAVILMVIDHIGAFFFPDTLWFRAIGRGGGAPVWLFLIGYATTRDISDKIIIGAGMIAIANFALFNDVFSLNILFAIILVRLFIDPVMRFVTQTRYLFALSVLVLTMAFVPTNMVIEYGTFNLLFAMAGYLVRHQDDLTKTTFLQKGEIYSFIVFIVLAYCFFENGIFPFSDIQFLVMLILVSCLMVMVVLMKPMTFPQITDPRLVKMLQFGGRRTLEIYVAHFILFKVILFAFLALN